jgi:hypothetical protein
MQTRSKATHADHEQQVQVFESNLKNAILNETKEAVEVLLRDRLKSVGDANVLDHNHDARSLQREAELLRPVLNTMNHSRQSTCGVAGILANEHKLAMLEFLIGKIQKTGRHSALGLTKKNRKGWTCLNYALHSLEIMKCLVQQGAKVNTQDNEGKNLVWYAMAEGELESLLWLVLEKEVEISQDDYLNRALVSLVFDKGEDAIIQFCITLHTLSQFGCKHQVECLWAKMSELINQKIQDLEYAARFNKALKIIRWVYRCGGDINACLEGVGTLPMELIKGGYIEEIKWLIRENRLHPNLSLLAVAVKAGQDKIADFLKIEIAACNPGLFMPEGFTRDSLSMNSSTFFSLYSAAPVDNGSLVQQSGNSGCNLMPLRIF